MKIALIIAHYDPHGGGAERWTDRHARRLLKLGHEVHVLARHLSDPPPGLICRPIAVKRRLTSQRLDFADQAARLLERETFDVSHDMGDGWHADLFMPHHGTRAAGFAQNACLTPAWLRPLRYLAQRWMPRYREFAALEQRQYDLRSRTRFIALSRMVRSHMFSYYQVPPDRCDIVYNGVDTHRFAPASPASRHALRQQMRLEDKIALLFVAHNFRLKGLDPLLEAFASLCRRDSRLTLLVVGRGRQSEYEHKARRLGCASGVHFVGDQPDPIPFYQAADLYVQPTFYDPCSLVALEALACGLPVITSRYNGVGELITDGQEGFVVTDPKDVMTLQHRIENLLDRETRRSASEAARALASQHTLERNCAALLQLYETCRRARIAA